MPKKITITLDPKLVVWARRQAADENLSLSTFIARLLQNEMRDTDAYWRAYEEWKRLPDDLGGSIDASKRLTREEVHERRGPSSLVQATSREANQFDRALQEMAADPQIRSECDAIARDFASFELEDSPED